MGNTEGNNEMISDSASPMLGQHLFRMESGEGLRSSKPPTEERQIEFTDESNMEEDITDSDPSGPPARQHQEPVKIAVNFSTLALNLGAAPSQSATANNQILACQLENNESEMTD